MRVNTVVGRVRAVHSAVTAGTDRSVGISRMSSRSVEVATTAPAAVVGRSSRRIAAWLIVIGHFEGIYEKIWSRKELEGKMSKIG